MPSPRTPAPRDALVRQWLTEPEKVHVKVCPLTVRTTVGGVQYHFRRAYTSTVSSLDVRVPREFLEVVAVHEIAERREKGGRRRLSDEERAANDAVARRVEGAYVRRFLGRRVDAYRTWAERHRAEGVLAHAAWSTLYRLSFSRRAPDDAAVDFGLLKDEVMGKPRHGIQGFWEVDGEFHALRTAVQRLLYPTTSSPRAAGVHVWSEDEGGVSTLGVIMRDAVISGGVQAFEVEPYSALFSFWGVASDDKSRQLYERIVSHLRPVDS